MSKLEPGDRNGAVRAYRYSLTGRVQGVGFRPFVYRLAVRNQVIGSVRNCMGRVEIHAQGTADNLASFERGLIEQAPGIARPVIADKTVVAATAGERFQILQSESAGEAAIHLPPDYFACAGCLREVDDPTDRRYRYPFINCTQCGPRYTLIRALPYDRPNTTMADFPLCESCAAEYSNPMDRRFHAEPVACPVCGPSLSFVANPGERIGDTQLALQKAVEVLSAGEIVAVKGVGGYHLLCDATNDAAIRLLRGRKPRPDKPLAVMFPAPADAPLSVAGRDVELPSPVREALLQPERPIVLCQRKDSSRLSSLIAPGLREVGIMLPYSPLHHLLLQDFGGPLVATSGNISGEPVITDNAMAEQRLGHIAAAFLHHDRPIQRPADDSVYRVMQHAVVPMRLGRGVAPLEIDLPFALRQPVVAVGGHMKNTVALAWGSRAVVSPHIGELDNVRGLQVFQQVVGDLQTLYGVQAQQLICDAHPRYASSRWAHQQSLPVQPVYHHHAHASALALEDTLQENALVFTWDGVGYGEDGQLWGGEALIGCPGNWRRYASFRPFRLPGGEKAGREPWRSAAALLWHLSTSGSDPNVDKLFNLGSDPTVDNSLALLHSAWQRGINAPWSSAAGRLFDAAAALTGVCTRASFEGQGPMLLEASCQGDPAALPLPIARHTAGHRECDWAPLVPMLQDEQLTVGERAAVFHASMAGVILDVARLAREELGTSQVGLAGGVFQNRILTDRALKLLEDDGFQCVFGKTIPANDGGLCIGQVIEHGYRKTVD